MVQHKTGARVVAFYCLCVSDLHGTNYYCIKAESDELLDVCSEQPKDSTTVHFVFVILVVKLSKK